jgi:hypothetical protein
VRSSQMAMRSSLDRLPLMGAALAAVQSPQATSVRLVRVLGMWGRTLAGGGVEIYAGMKKSTMVVVKATC